MTQRAAGGGLDRRGFMRAAGLLLAAGPACLAPHGTPAAVAPRPAAPAPALSARRRAGYRALVDALRRAPEGRFRHRDPARAASAFADWYARQDSAGRRHADAVLDAVAPLLAGAPDAAARYAVLADPPGGPEPDEAQARGRAALMAALAIADPRPRGEDDRTPPDALA